MKAFNFKLTRHEFWNAVAGLCTELTLALLLILFLGALTWLLLRGHP